ncbi:MAG: hypothetical protein IKR19_08000 [Acholeplasmatales bacterium]|nr:hypothetical protein [Acholeplasmatales bacterium]
MSALNFSTFILENVDFVNEAYVGKTPTLEKIEQKIGELRSKLKFSGANSTLKETLEINRLFEEQFGMEVFALKILAATYENAYTIVLANRFDIAEFEDLPSMVEANPTTGYRFKKDNNFCIIMNITTQLIMDTDYTDAEILAILLHELGHNFADCIYDDINIANKDMMNTYRTSMVQAIIMLAISIIGLPAAVGLFVRFLKELKELNNKNRNKAEKKGQKIGKGKLSAFIASIKAKINGISDLVSGILFRLSGAVNTYKRSLEISGDKDKARKSLGRQNEVIADKFAGIYGYGPDLATALLKLEATASASEKAVDKLGKFGKDINDKYTEAMLDINDYDVHPQVIQRIFEEIKLLENELKKEDLDPKVKKVIQDQLNQLREVIKIATTVKDEMNKREKTKTLYNQYIANECPDAVDKEIEDKIEESLDKVLNGGK